MFVTYFNPYKKLQLTNVGSIHQTLPKLFFDLKIFSGSCSCCKLNTGAGLPINGEGTLRGLRLSPTSKNAARIIKAINGSK